MAVSSTVNGEDASRISTVSVVDNTPPTMAMYHSRVDPRSLQVLIVPIGVSPE